MAHVFTQQYFQNKSVQYQTFDLIIVQSTEHWDLFNYSLLIVAIIFLNIVQLYYYNYYYSLSQQFSFLTLTFINQGKLLSVMVTWCRKSKHLLKEKLTSRTNMKFQTRVFRSESFHLSLAFSLILHICSFYFHLK